MFSSINESKNGQNWSQIGIVYKSAVHKLVTDTIKCWKMGRCIEDKDKDNY